jgi:hypothetical protein
MDDELCDTVVMGAVQLQATFSVKAPGRIESIQRARTMGALEQRLHTRYGRIAVCIAIIACHAFHHHRRAAARSISLDALCDLYDALVTPTRRC